MQPSCSLLCEAFSEFKLGLFNDSQIANVALFLQMSRGRLAILFVKCICLEDISSDTLHMFDYFT